MANRVITVFEGDAKQLFATADAVEARINKISNVAAASAQSPASAAQSASPIVAAEKAATQAVVTESANRERVEQAASKKSQDLVKQELSTHVDFFKARQGALERAAVAEAAMEDKAAAAALKRSAIEQAAEKKAFDFRVLVAVERDKLTLQSVRRAITAEEATTAVVVREAEKQAVARRGSFFSRDSLSIPGPGGISSRIGIIGPAALGIGAGVALVAGEIAAIKAYNAEVTDASQRTARLSAASSDLGIAQKDLSKAVDETAVSLRTTKAEAVDIVTAVADLASKTKAPLADLNNSIIDLASARGIDKSSLPSLLNDIGQGTANAALLGQNAAAIFDEYAAKLGKTAEKLSDAEKRQALVNRLLSEGALNAGASANSLDKDAVSVDALDKAWTKFLATLAGASAAKSGLDALTKALGGEPEFGRFDPSRAFNTPGFGNVARTDSVGLGFLIRPELRDRLTPEKIFADDIAAADAETQKRHAEYRRLFEENRQAIIDAAKAPTANVVNAALAGLNFDELSKKYNPEDLRKFLDKQVVDFKSLQESRSRAIETGLEQGIGNVSELRRLSKIIPQQIIDPDEVRRLSQLASKDIADTFRDAIESAKSKIPQLRDLYKQIAIAPDIGTLEKNGLLRSINDQIDQTIKSQQERVKQIAETTRSAFEGVFTREGSRNPFLNFLDEADKRMRTLIKNTDGLSNALRNTLLEREKAQDNLDLLGLRFNSRDAAFNLNDEASTFKRFKLTGSTDSAAVNSLKGFIAAQGPLNPQAQAFYDQWLKQVQNQDAQDRLNRQIEIARSSFLSGSNPSADARSLFDKEIIKLTPLDKIDQLSSKQLDLAISARQEEADHQLQAEQDAAKQRDEQLKVMNELSSQLKGLLDLANKGGLPVNLGNQAITVVEVTSPNLSVTKRTSAPGPRKTTADAMQP
jgi:hypothetical protein